MLIGFTVLNLRIRNFKAAEGHNSAFDREDLWSVKQSNSVLQNNRS